MVPLTLRQLNEYLDMPVMHEYLGMPVMQITDLLVSDAKFVTDSDVPYCAVTILFTISFFHCYE